MAGISSHALKGNIYPENKKKSNGIEFNDDFDINEYEANYRILDSQIGRWARKDPKIDQGMERRSPYASNYDNPIKYNDPLGNRPDQDGPDPWGIIKYVAGRQMPTICVLFAKDDIQNYIIKEAM
jgi:RHS repeat-associated protein